MNLVKIKSEDIIFTNHPFEECVNTELHLLDNSWMSYQLITEFNTSNQGKMKVTFQYYGTKQSEMVIERCLDGKTEITTYEYSTEIFEKHITRFMTRHLAAWKDTYAFNGEDLVIDFFNDVIENGTV